MSLKHTISVELGVSVEVKVNKLKDISRNAGRNVDTESGSIKLYMNGGNIEELKGFEVLVKVCAMKAIEMSERGTEKCS